MKIKHAIALTISATTTGCATYTNVYEYEGYTDRETIESGQLSGTERLKARVSKAAKEPITYRYAYLTSGADLSPQAVDALGRANRVSGSKLEFAIPATAFEVGDSDVHVQNQLNFLFNECETPKLLDEFVGEAKVVWTTVTPEAHEPQRFGGDEPSEDVVDTQGVLDTGRYWDAAYEQLINRFRVPHCVNGTAAQLIAVEPDYGFYDKAYLDNLRKRDREAAEQDTTISSVSVTNRVTTVKDTEKSIWPGKGIAWHLYDDYCVFRAIVITDSSRL